MFRILQAQSLAPGIKRFVVEAPRIARRHQAGQFVIVRVYERGERVPLTIESSDSTQETISIVVQAAGKTTRPLNELEAGDGILDVVGPLGKPSEIAQYGTVVVVSGGVGTAEAYPTTKALKQAGNQVDARQSVGLRRDGRSDKPRGLGVHHYFWALPGVAGNPGMETGPCTCL